MNRRVEVEMNFDNATWKYLSSLICHLIQNLSQLTKYFTFPINPLCHATTLNAKKPVAKPKDQKSSKFGRILANKSADTVT